MSSEQLLEMFEGDSADMCVVKFPLVSMGGRESSVRRPGSEDPIGMSENLFVLFHNLPTPGRMRIMKLVYETHANNLML